MRTKDILGKLGVSKAALYQWKKAHIDTIENKKGIWTLKQ